MWTKAGWLLVALVSGGGACAESPDEDADTWHKLAFELSWRDQNGPNPERRVLKPLGEEVEVCEKLAERAVRGQQAVDGELRGLAKSERRLSKLTPSAPGTVGLWDFTKREIEEAKERLANRRTARDRTLAEYNSQHAACHALQARAERRVQEFAETQRAHRNKPAPDSQSRAQEFLELRRRAAAEARDARSNR